jgi:hypothetical protein
MPNDPAVSEEMVTVLVADEPTEQALAESVLREANVPFVVRNAGVQHLVGAGQIGGFNVMTGPPEIQVAPSDVLRATHRLREALGFEEREPEADSAAEAADRALVVRYSRYSAAWAVLSILGLLWGVLSLPAVFYGIKALRRSRGALTLTKGLAVFGLALGILSLVYWSMAWGASLLSRI